MSISWKQPKYRRNTDCDFSDYYDYYDLIKVIQTVIFLIGGISNNLIKVIKAVIFVINAMAMI